MAAVDYLYSLYDALISINVPNDKARAVVDAMERDMTTALATKPDLQLLKQGLTASMDAVTAEMRRENALMRKDMEILSDRIAAMSTNITLRLGSTMVALTGLLFAALKLT